MWVERSVILQAARPVNALGETAVIPKIADWKRNTSSCIFAPRTAELQTLDVAIAAHGEQPSPAHCHGVKHAFQAWKASYPVGCFSSYRRNSHGMVDALEQEFAPSAAAEAVAPPPVLTDVVAPRDNLAGSSLPRPGADEEKEEGRWVYHAASFEDLMGIRITGLDLGPGTGRAATELVANDTFMQASDPLEHASLEPMSHKAATFRAPLNDAPAFKPRLNRGYAGVLKRAADPVEPLRNTLAIMLRYPAREGCDSNTVRPSVIEGLTAKGWVNIAILIELDHARLMAREAPAAAAGYGPIPWFGAMSRARSISGIRSL
ncbi:MAG: hypothetical protein RLZZ618_2884 [Pseudomonadota bacterium]|jgi:hypothetical protein